MILDTFIQYIYKRDQDGEGSRNIITNHANEKNKNKNK
jgi:hypothetical protein